MRLFRHERRSLQHRARTLRGVKQGEKASGKALSGLLGAKRVFVREPVLHTKASVILTHVLAYLLPLSKTLPCSNKDV